MSAAADSVYATIGGTPGVISIVWGGFIAIVVTRYYANKGKDIKALGWIPLGVTRIVRRPVTDISQGLALTWKGKPLGTPYTAQLRISNIGTKEVIGSSRPNSDYERPLVVDFGESTCYEAIVTETSGTTLETPISLLDAPANEFEVPMPTLNASAWIELEIVADGKAGYPHVDCFLAGQTEQIMPVAGRQRRRIRSTMLAIGGLGIVVATIGFGLIGLVSLNGQGPGVGPTALLIAGIAVTIGAALTYGWSWSLDRQELNAMKRAEPSAFESGR
jgi:hypothetical protein